MHVLSHAYPVLIVSTHVKIRICNMSTTTEHFKIGMAVSNSGLLTNHIPKSASFATLVVEYE